jgi:hypothetical protein
MFFSVSSFYAFFLRETILVYFLAARATGQHLLESLRANVFTKYVHLALGAKAQQKPFLRAKMWVLEVGKDLGSGGNKGRGLGKGGRGRV